MIIVNVTRSEQCTETEHEMVTHAKAFDDETPLRMVLDWADNPYGRINCTPYEKSPLVVIPVQERLTQDEEDADGNLG